MTLPSNRGQSDLDDGDRQPHGLGPDDVLGRDAQPATRLLVDERPCPFDRHLERHTLRRPAGPARRDPGRVDVSRDDAGRLQVGQLDVGQLDVRELGVGELGVGELGVGDLAGLRCGQALGELVGVPELDAEHHRGGLSVGVVAPDGSNDPLVDADVDQQLGPLLDVPLLDRLVGRVAVDGQAERGEHVRFLRQHVDLALLP